MKPAPQTGHVFISYRQQEPDKQFAHELAWDLQAAGHPVWIDIQGIEAGETWNTEIQNALDECYAYVVVLSPEAMGSRWVRNELLYALREKAGRIFPVMLINVKLPPELIAIQYVDFQGNYRKALASLLANLPVPPDAAGASTGKQALQRPEPPRRKLPTWLLGVAGLVVVGLAVGIGLLTSNPGGRGTPTPSPGPGTPTVEPQQTEATTATAGATSAPTATLGGPDTPITFVFLAEPATSSHVLVGVRTITAKLSEMTGFTIRGEVETSQRQIVDDLCSHKTQVSTLTPLSYLLAKERGDCAIVTAISLRSGSRYFTSQIIARNGVNRVTDLKDKSFCRVDAESASGWIMQSLLLKAQGVDPEVDFREIKDKGDHKEVVVAVYNGECDGGATFSDARYNAATDLPDVWSKVIVLEPTTTGVPNDTIGFAPDVPAEMRDAITGALIEMAGDEAQVEVLRETSGWNGIQKADEELFNAFDAFEQLFKSSGYKLEDIVK